MTTKNVAAETLTLVAAIHGGTNHLQRDVIVKSPYPLPAVAF